MKSILIAVMLIIVILSLYDATIGNGSGVKQQLESRGSAAQSEIGGIEP